MGVANTVWYYDHIIPGPIAVHRDNVSGNLILAPANSPSQVIVWFALIDFSAQINNLVYLNVKEQQGNISIAFSDISAVHNIFVHLSPFSAEQVRAFLFGVIV